MGCPWLSPWVLFLGVLFWWGVIGEEIPTIGKSLNAEVRGEQTAEALRKARNHA